MTVPEDSRGMTIVSPHDNSEHPAELIDGVLRHTHNSEGRIIHPSAQGRANFHKWFSDSKVVDKHGRPRVMYHGTTSPEHINSFSTGSVFDEYGELRHQASTDPTAHVGPHFAEEPHVASAFAAGNAAQWDKDRQIGKDRGAHGRVFPVYLSIKNPAKHSDTGFQFATYRHGKSSTLDYYLDDAAEQHASQMDDEEEAEHYLKTAKFDPEEMQAIHLQHVPDDGDGSQSERMSVASELGDSYKRHLIKNGRDGVRYRNEIEGGISWVALHPHQIKSATGNSGAFSPESGMLRESTNRIVSRINRVLKEGRTQKEIETGRKLERLRALAKAGHAQARALLHQYDAVHAARGVRNTHTELALGGFKKPEEIR